jgi:hypothetical protein
VATFSRVTRLGKFLPLFYFWHFLTTEKAHILGVNIYFRGTIYVFILTKICWATLWDVFFANSSGHPDFEQPAPFFRGLSSERFQIISKERCMEFG